MSSDLLWNVLFHNIAEFPQAFTMGQVIAENVGVVCVDNNNSNPSIQSLIFKSSGTKR